MSDFLVALRKLIEAIAPALAVALWDYEESKVDAAKHEALDAQVNLELEKNHEAIDKANAGKSDADILRDAISKGSSGEPKS